MPFDGKLTDFIPVPTVKPFEFETATGDQRLLELALNLENPDLWAGKIMVWDFAYSRVQISHSCGTAGCAIGLADLLWPQAAFDTEEFSWSSRRVMEIFDISDEELINLFSERFAVNRGIAMPSVTPGMVATAIREFVAARQS